MEKRKNRLTVYGHDVRKITGQSVRTAYRIMAEVRKQCGIKGKVPIKIHEFCQVTGYPIEMVREMLD